ncbi:MAG TPA: di-heme oxidoredictase family protein [Polyangiaceae bacterium LLY-WYZ-15_(1-7)]|nr:thiol oxidoreductase [Myxococcales bacterium]MAT24451.1 thiol oxidoreductase [Sandaracinus sp.]HJK90790.1 di-heme oxidoredictase family protein [Polyangiaceae bacterium LLY-WYZ-15_(1-7)]MBJ70832.1 thiol oxidoreductase [Sandaracinus sp.]HJL00794.1 di-heme oxidoredictase family protein [Polyangiaceae bacterium LLY-WYZ-15_(1-7)]
MRRIAPFAIALLVACSSGRSPEPGEARSGGDATHFLLFGSQSFTFPAPNLSSERRAAFFTGNAFFNQGWVTAPASTTARDGLGPTFHAGSCSACHFRDGRGAPPDEGGTVTEGTIPLAIGRGPDGAPLGDPSYGTQLQPFAIMGVEGEARPVVRWEEVLGEYGDGEPYSLRRPVLTLEDPAFGPFHPDLVAEVRMAPAMIGLGLLEALPDATLEAFADPEDADGDGISGRVQRVVDAITGERVIGRFGWKAGQPTVLHQSAAAFSGDMGLTSRVFPDENCPPAQEACAAAPTGGEPEVQDDILDDVAFYSRTLAVPARRAVDDPEVLRGRDAMVELGCTGCHAPRLETGTLEGFPELSNQTIRPYTDLLLHDMGEDLAGRPEFEASEAEWRTPPLWGVGLIDTVNGHTHLLHDGRARGFAEAILWHGGEAEAAREAFRTAPRRVREALLRFLETL